MKKNYLREFIGFASSCRFFYIELTEDSDGKKAVQHDPFGDEDYLRIGLKKLEYDKYRKMMLKKTDKAIDYLRKTFAKHGTKYRYFLERDLVGLDDLIPGEELWDYEIKENEIEITTVYPLDGEEDMLKKSNVKKINRTLKLINESVTRLFNEYKFLERVLKESTSKKKNIIEV